MQAGSFGAQGSKADSLLLSFISVCCQAGVKHPARLQWLYVVAQSVYSALEGSTGPFMCSMGSSALQMQACPLAAAVACLWLRVALLHGGIKGSVLVDAKWQMEW